MMMITQAATLPSIARKNVAIYEFLALVFSTHPTRDSVYSLREMAKTLEIPYSSDLSLADLDREYMELFVIPNPRYCAPYESVYRDHWEMPASLKRGSNPGEASVMIKGLVMGESTQAVRQCYDEVGGLPADDLPDHIANELRFMAYLWSIASDASAKLRAKFCEEHLLAWVHQLLLRVEESEHRVYYSVALQVTEAVLRDDSKRTNFQPSWD